MLAVEPASASLKKASPLTSLNVPQVTIEYRPIVYPSISGFQFSPSKPWRKLDIENGNALHAQELFTLSHANHQNSKYSLQGTDYNLVLASFDNIGMPDGKLIYETRLVDDLPTKIQTFIQQRHVPNSSYIAKLAILDAEGKEYLANKNELTFTNCLVYSMPDNSKHYEVFVNYFGMTDLPLIFDENSNLIWVGNFNRLESIKHFDDLLGGSSKVSQAELDLFSSEINSITEFKEFKIVNPTLNSQASLNTYAGVKSYEFVITKEGPNGLESRTLRFDGKRKLISTYYDGR
jgi:hypothetical protein